MGEPGGGYKGGTDFMEHWVWCINNEFWDTEKKLNSVQKINHK